MQQLATTIREQVDLLVDQYDARLRTRPGYSSLPEALRRDLERQFLNTIVECLEKGDSTILVDYARQRAAQWQALGLNLAWFQQALIIPEELLIPLVHSVAASNFVWQALNRSQSVIWQMMAEHAQHTEDRFRSIVETSHSGVLITDDTFHLTYVNDELLQISGYTREELLNLDFRQLLDEESRQLLVEHYIRRQRGEEAPTRYEVAFLRKDGTKRHLEMSAVSLKDASGKSYTVAQVLDVTEQKQAEAALAQERNLLRTLIDTLPDQVFVKDQQGRILLYNQADARAMRVDSIEAALGKTVYDLYPRELAETYHADDMAVIRSDQPLYDREEPALDEAGQERWVLTTKVPLKDQAGQRVGLVGIARDITRRKQAEMALRENEEKLRAIYEGSNDAVMLLNEQGFFDCNTQTLKLFGVDSKDVFVRLHPSDLSPALQPDGQDSLAASQQRIQTAYQQGYNRFDWVHRRLNGEDFPAEVLLSAFEYGGKRVLQATVRDITERKHAEEALAQSVEKQQKLTQRLRAAMEATDELMRLTDLDTLYRRAVELAREKLGVERCGLLLVDPTGQYVLGTYGTDEQGQTTDEHALRDPIATHQNVFNVQEGFGIVQEAAQRHWKDNEFHAVGTGWVGSTAIRGEAGPLGILYNDAAISKTPPDQDLQGTLAVYCSMLSNIIENKRLEQQVRDALQKEHNASERLRTVINIGYELIRTPDLDTLYRETVELAHARLGVERCGLYILDDTGDYLVGMYGTDDQGNTIDQRSPANRLPTAQGMERDLLFSPQKRLWTTLHKERTLWREGQLIELEPGWNVATVLQGPSGPRGILYNDAAISNAPYDETLQETIALYCTTVGNIIENKRLEQNIRESLLRRSIQVQTSIEVAQYVAAAPELGELFHRVVTLIKERFNYYHVQLFRYEPTEDTVKLITGYGKIGQKMLAAGHKLALGQGVVGTAAATGQAILAADVTRDLDWRPNPHLPATQGELAVPIKMGGGDAESQLNALKYFVQGNLDGMMITAIDPEAVAHITHASLQQGKPVVSVSTDLGEDNQTALVFSVEHELGYLLGVQAGNWAKQHVPDDQNVKLGMLNYRTLPQVLQRERGIIDGIQSVIGERVTIVVSGSATEAKEAAYLAQGWLRDHPELNMIVAINDATALGAYQAAQIMGRHDPDEFFIGGIDAVPEALAAIQQGGVYQATVNQPPEIMGLMAVRLLVAAIKGLPVKPVYTLYCLAVNRSNVAQFSGPSRKEMLFANQDIIPAELFSGLEVGGLRLGLSVLTLANPFFAALVKSAHEEAQRLGVQLVVNDPSHILGVLDIQSDQVNTLTDEDRLLLEGLCGQIASAMESTRLLERTETLYNISSRLNAAQTYDDVLTTLRLHTVLQQADLNISINLFDRPWIGDDIPEWSIALCRWSALPVSAVSSRYPLRAFSAASLLLHSDEPSIISDVQRDSRLDDATRELYGKRFGAGSTIFAPLVAAGQWIGYVNGIFQQPRTFSEEETRLLLAAVGQASTVIESLRRLDELTTSESQLSEALRASRLANWEYDIAADTFTFNDRFYALLRTTAEREGGYTMSAAQYAQRFVHPDDAALVGHEVQLAIETADPKFTRQIDHRIFYADGEMGYFNVRFRIEKDAQGRTIKTYGANQDITERKRAEAEREQLLATQQRRAVQLQTASEVSRAASSILNAEELLPQAAELIRARFGFYYVGIFLADETKHWAILQAGTGSAGQQMLANKHRLEIGGNSMIGQCLVTQQARIALDVGEEAVHFDNPLLPLTHSEMALPLISRGHIIGAMTIQSDQPAAFTADDIAVLQSMADQIAVALANATSYAEAQAAARQAHALYVASQQVGRLEVGL
ncbi:MAG TPA: PAS domain S-box protein, partial [Anaerolineae bacterium]|nr:PAS domain S-box protein [Anaerolineae bacterium]